jgi:hypothetical protein
MSIQKAEGKADVLASKFHAMKNYRRMEAKPCAFFTSPLYGGDGQVHDLANFLYPRKEPWLQLDRKSVGPRRLHGCGVEEKNPYLVLLSNSDRPANSLSRY